MRTNPSPRATAMSATSLSSSSPWMEGREAAREVHSAAQVALQVGGVGWGVVTCSRGA